MLFNSLTYLFFFLVVVLVLYIIPAKFQWLWLLVSSIFFYYTLSPIYLVLYVSLVIINYSLGILIERSGAKRKNVFFISIGINVFVLVFFKYIGFFQLLTDQILGLSESDPILRIILPVGLSFFVFTILSYLIEVKRGAIQAERHVGIFASSLMFFPKMMQGPIERPGHIFPQFKEEKYFNYEGIIEGLKLMLWGYFKKLVIADRMALYVNAVYDNYEHHSGLTLLVATFFYAVQIYADFSGYTDIALGSAGVLGFNLTDNFKRPYFATSIKDFWNRWHISLSTWLRDYIFLPLAVIMAGKLRQTKYLGLPAEKWIFMSASIITFSICGLWHGEGLNFLLWGLLFGIYLTVANWTLGLSKYLRKKLNLSKSSTLYRVYGISITFLLVSFSWIFFRADTTHDAISIIKSISSLNGPLFIVRRTLIFSMIGLSILFFVDAKREFSLFGNLTHSPKNGIIEHIKYVALILIILLIGVFDGGQFIYFQF